MNKPTRALAAEPQLAVQGPGGPFSPWRTYESSMALGAERRFGGLIRQ
jgi:hypothetical protein